MMEPMTLDDIALLFRRRRAQFHRVSGTLLLLTLLLVLSWSRYRAEATIEIEQAVIPAGVTAIGSGEGTPPAILADRRIRAIEQTVTAPESLGEIIRTLGLYPQLATHLTPVELAAKMRRDIHLRWVTESVANPMASQKESIEQLSASAFTLQFDYPDAALGQQALDALIVRFIAEEQAQRRHQSEQTLQFLDEQIAALETNIHEQEKAIAQFRAEHGESGPAALMMHQQASLADGMSLQQLDTAISTGEATLGALRGQLAATDPYLPLVDDKQKVISSPAGQLKALRAQMAALSGRYGPDHPDILKLKRQIAALKKSTPAVRRANTADADNPAYLQLAAQLAAAQAQQKALIKQRAALAARKTAHEAAISGDPITEQQLSQLTLDLDNAKQRYRTLKDKRLAAAMQQKLDAGDHSAHLKIITPSTLPTHNFPDRRLLIMLGAMFSLLSGALAVFLAEWLRPTIRSASQLTRLVGVAPLMTLPTLRGRA